MEQLKLSGTRFAYAATDVWKAFDQIVPELLHLVLAVAGAPPAILGPYIRLMSSLAIRNSLGTGLG
eukprot:10884233-Alexandrium_andersonii.AAC.1